MTVQTRMLRFTWTDVRWIVAVALVLRLLLLLMALDQAGRYPLQQQRPFEGGDSDEYLLLASNWVDGGVYSLSPLDAGFSIPNTTRPPLYSLGLALLYALNGAQHQLAQIVAVQVLLGTLNVYLLIRLMRLLTDERVAALAGWLYALSVMSIALTGLVLTETPFSSVMLLALWAWVRLCQTPHARQRLVWALLTGVLFALLTYLRAIALYMLLLAMLALGVALVLEQGRALRLAKLWHKVVVPCALMALSFAVLVFPWYARNYAEFGVWSFSSIGDFNLLNYNAPSVVSYQRGIGVREARNSVWEAFQADFDQYMSTVNPNPNPLVTAGLQRDKALEFLLANPVQTLIVHVRDMLNIFRPGYSTLNLVLHNDPEVFGDNDQNISLDGFESASLLDWFWYACLTLQVGVVYVGMGLGILSGMFQRRHLWWVFSFSLMLVWLSITPSIAGNARFRVPIEGIMAGLAALGYFSVWRAWQTWRKPSLT